MTDAWTTPVRLAELDRGVVRVRLAPDDAQRAAVAARLGLVSLPELRAELTLAPWMDGAEITGRVEAVVEQVCGVSLDAFTQAVESPIDLRVVPPGSPQAQAPDAPLVELDLDAPDPPDVLEGDAIDLAHYVMEHLGLSIDPFPRKPGAQFDYASPDPIPSPFAVLAALKAPPKDPAS